MSHGEEVYSSNGVMSDIFSLTGPARSRCESMFIRCVVIGDNLIRESLKC